MSQTICVTKEENYQLSNENLVYDDTIFMYISNKNTFICRNPQLGYEKQQGGSTTN